MDKILFLVKCITLLYRENQLAVKSETSNELVRIAIDQIKTADLNVGLSTNADAVHSLKDTIIEMCKNGSEHEYDKVSLLQRLKLNCKSDEKLYEALVQGIDLELPESSLKRTITNLRKSINNHFKEEKINDILNKASYDFKYRRDNIKDIGQFVMEHIAQLEPLRTMNTVKDPAIISDIDLGDINSTVKVFKEVKANDSSDGLLKCGFTAINNMTQGGFRRGEFTRIDALQHKYKTGFTLSLFAQIVMFNTPYMLDVAKKPLLLRISFEDELSSNLKFLYQYLKTNDGIHIDDIPAVPEEEMSIYIREKLQVNGYHIKMRRVDPSKWTYLHLCNYIIELEAQNFEVHLTMVDYLSKLPTTGCINTGPSGTDHHDLHSRMRNFFAARKCALISPHQFSADCKNLLRDGKTDLVKEVVGLGYTQFSKSLDQVSDLEILIHIEKFQKEYYLTCQRGKHRGQDVIDDNLKYCVYKFPKKGPILHDINGIDTSLSRVGGTVSNSVIENSFEFSVL